MQTRWTVIDAALTAVIIAVGVFLGMLAYAEWGPDAITLIN